MSKKINLISLGKTFIAQLSDEKSYDELKQYHEKSSALLGDQAGAVVFGEDKEPAWVLTPEDDEIMTVGKKVVTFTKRKKQGK